MDTFEFILEIVATVFYAISGIRLAAVKKFDWFGAYSIGFVTAIGGGTMRDVFLGINPFWMLDPWYAIATIAALPVVMVFRRYLVRLEGTFYIFDAIGLALFVNVGIYKTLMLESSHVGGADYGHYHGVPWEACCATSSSMRCRWCSARRFMLLPALLAVSCTG